MCQVGQLPGDTVFLAGRAWLKAIESQQQSSNEDPSQHNVFWVWGVTHVHQSAATVAWQRPCWPMLCYSSTYSSLSPIHLPVHLCHYPSCNPPSSTSLHGIRPCCVLFTRVRGHT